jgi:hypothetical protein
MKTRIKNGKGPSRPKSAAGSVNYGHQKTVEPDMLREAALAYDLVEEPMVRTQIYLSREEHQFVQQESVRQGQPMAAIIRAFIDEKMEIPDNAWTNNSLLASPADPGFAGPEDGVINHDHYVYGTPKKWMKRNGQWVETPALPEDYHSNPASAAAYDRLVEGKG